MFRPGFIGAGWRTLCDHPHPDPLPSRERGIAVTVLRLGHPLRVASLPASPSLREGDVCPYPLGSRVRGNDWLGMRVVDGTGCEGRFGCSGVFIGSLRWGGIDLRAFRRAFRVSCCAVAVILWVARSGASGVNLSPRSLAVALLPHTASSLRRMGRDGRGGVVFRLGWNDGCVFEGLGGILPGLFTRTVLG